MSTVVIGSLVFVGLYIISAIIIRWHVGRSTKEEEFKSEHQWYLLLK